MLPGRFHLNSGALSQIFSFRFHTKCCKSNAGGWCKVEESRKGRKGRVSHGLKPLFYRFTD